MGYNYQLSSTSEISKQNINMNIGGGLQIGGEKQNYTFEFIYFYYIILYYVSLNMFIYVSLKRTFALRKMLHLL